MIRPLIWKEWREQRWKIAFGTIMLVSFAGSLVAARIISYKEVVYVTWLIGGMILALYSAMGVFAPEKSNKTIAFLSSRPIEPWKVFLCKWFFGWLNFAVPLLFCSLIAAVYLLVHPQEHLLDMLIRVTCLGLTLGTMFYSMTCCFAPRKSGEAFVGLTGLIVLFAFIVHAMTVEIALRTSLQSELSLLHEILLFINPFLWISVMARPYSDMHLSILILEQTALFAFTMWIGLRKWRRSI